MKRLKRILKNCLWFIILPLVVAIVLRVFCFEMYKIPSSSMEPTLVPGDFIMVNKLIYGARLLRLGKLHREKKIEYTRILRLGRIRRGDVFVFNWPQYFTLNSPTPNMFGDFIVKRCYGLPGDTVIIRTRKPDQSMINGKTSADLFPHDSTLRWTVDYYGPLWVPGKDLTLKLNAVNARRYADVLCYEGYKVEIRGDSVFLNGRYAPHITFNHNYYFMKGDNFYGSMDSRFWGFVPEENIIGRTKFVLFSYGLDDFGNWRFKWKRLCKLLK